MQIRRIQCEKCDKHYASIHAATRIAPEEVTIHEPMNFAPESTAQKPILVCSCGALTALDATSLPAVS